MISKDITRSIGNTNNETLLLYSKAFTRFLSPSFGESVCTIDLYGSRLL